MKFTLEFKPVTYKLRSDLIFVNEDGQVESTLRFGSSTEAEKYAERWYPTQYAEWAKREI